MNWTVRPACYSTIFAFVRLYCLEILLFINFQSFELGTDNYLKSNAFQRIFFITFCKEDNFFTTIF